MLARSKLNSIETKISGALINHETSHEDFKSRIKRKHQNDEQWKK